MLKFKLTSEKADMSDHLLDDQETDGLENPDESLTADLNEQDDDSSLLDTALPDVHDDVPDDVDESGDHDDLLAPTPTDEHAEHLLDNTTDEDPVSCLEFEER